MLLSAIILAYSAANIVIAGIVLIKSPRITLSRFYAFCVALLLFLGGAGYCWTVFPAAEIRPVLGMAINFVYALFPFFFLHFIVLFVRRYEVINSRLVTMSIYAAGLFGYAMILLGRIPEPLSDANGITQSGYAFYLTWLTIFFAIGVAMLYELSRGFSERAGRSKLLFVAFALLLMLLPGPFTESVFFGIFHLGAESYYISCTMALTIAVYFIFRHKIIASTHFDELKSALGALSDLFVTTDAEFRIEMVRGSVVTSLLGYTEAEMRGRRLGEFLEEPDHLARYARESAASGDAAGNFDSGVRAREGASIPMNFSMKPMLVEGGIRGYVCLGRDMTERRRMEDELRQSQKMESIGTLAGGIAHDVNNILQIILINTLGLQKRDLTREQIEKIVSINTKAVDRGAMVVQQILTFARKAPVKFAVLDLNASVAEFLAMLTQTFPRTIEFQSELDPALPPIVADAGQLHQVLLNLCVNARDAMPRGGRITIRTAEIAGDVLRLRHAVTAVHPRYAVLSVADTGTGMDEKTRSHIFDPFFTTKEQGKGTGLGLSVVYGIVQSHHGIIDVESTPGAGTAFKVYFPVSEERERAVTVAPARESVAVSGTILLVEDEDIVRTSLARALEQEGFRVIVARDGIEGVETFLAHRERINLVILDIGLPRLGGWDAYLRMKESNAGLRSIISSGYLDPAIQAAKGTDGVVDYIIKPYATEAMIASVRKFFRNGPAS
jgi:PAS domain S-box-containing protein